MKTEQKLVGAGVLLAGLLGYYYYSSSETKVEREQRSRTSQKADLPSVALSAENVEKVTKLELRPAGKPAIVLEKQGDQWMLTAPITAKASAADIKTFLEALKSIKITDSVDSGTGTYDQYEVAEGKGTAFTASVGNEKVIQAVFGTSGTRGQTLRVEGRDGVWIADGYPASQFGKEAKNWRDKSIVKFEDTNVTSVDLENEHGKFVFMKEGDSWRGKFTAAAGSPKKDADKKDADKAEKADAPKKDADKKADKADAPKKDADKKADKADAPKKDADKKADKPVQGSSGWEKFDGKTVESMLRALKTLNATDFGEADADAGMKDAASLGGVVTIHFKDGTSVTVRVGKKQKGTSRFAQKDGDETLFVISSYAADWITAEASKYEKKEDKKAAGGDPHGGHGDDDIDLEMPGLDDE